MDRNVEVRLREALGNEEFETRLASGHFTPVIECPIEERQVRDEFARESDIAYQLKQFGAGQAFPRIGYNGTYDDTMDLLQAHRLVEESRELWARVPARWKEKYSTFAEFEADAIAGRLPKEEPPPVKEEPKT